MWWNFKPKKCGEIAKYLASYNLGIRFSNMMCKHKYFKKIGDLSKLKGLELYQKNIPFLWRPVFKVTNYLSPYPGNN